MNTYALYLVTDSELIAPMRIEGFLNSAIDGGVTVVQIREKNICTKDFIIKAREMKRILSERNIPLIVNDRLDVALAIEADGIHLGQQDVEYRDVKKILRGRKMTIGLTLENLEQAKRALKDNYDYFGLSSLFQTSTKQDAPYFWTKNQVESLRKITNKPLIGIGGINLDNCKEVLEYGLDGIAVVSAICGQRSVNDVEKVSSEFRKKVENYYED